MSRGTVEFRYRRTPRRIVLTFIALAGLLVFTPQAWAQVPSTTTVQAAPATATTGEPVVLTATVTCTASPAGGLGVTFFDGGDLLDTVPLNAGGQASLTHSFATEGTHTITAAYNGNNNCGASSSTTTVQISAAPPTPPTPPTPSCGCGSGLVNIHNSGNNGGRALS
jgi:hypothetical protein